MSHLSFSAAFASWCRDPSFHVATTSLFRLCCNTVLYYLHFYCDLESLSRQRLAATELDFLLQPCSNVTTWLLGVCQIFTVVTQISCRNKITLCSTYSFCRDLVCYVVIGLLCICVETSVTTQKVCRDGILPPLSLFPCCNFIFDVATWTFVLGMFCMLRPQYVMSR